MTPVTRFNRTIDHWIDALNRYTPEMLRQEPGPGSWSLGQVYTHLIDDTGYFVTQMKAALSSTGHVHEQMHADAAAMFARNGFPDIAIAGPATGKQILQPAHPRQSLEAIREDVNRLDFTQPSGKTRHPGLGFFSALEWLQFAEMHLRHHIRRQQRIETAIAAVHKKP
jgi:hypothetical protein